MTRACVALAQGNPALAWHYHPLSFILVAIAFFAACFPTASHRVWRRCSIATHNRIAIFGIGLSIGIWAYRIWEIGKGPM